MQKPIKIALAIGLFICLFDMPYGYFQLVRFAAMLAFSYFGMLAIADEKREMALLYFGLAILFQPLIKIALGRELWNIVDVIVGVGLLVSAFRTEKN